MKGLAFSQAMVLAVMSGAKTVTRRVSAVQWKRIVDRLADGSVLTERLFHRADQWVHPRYQPGEVVYVKEALERTVADSACYAADGTAVIENGNLALWRWKRDVLPARFMPRAAARTALKIVSVRPEPLQEITLDDLVAEGWPASHSVDEIGSQAYEWFADLWDSLHPKKDRWADNPWVWRYEFKQKDGE